MATTSDKQVNSNVAYLLQEYDDKKDNVTIITITYSDWRVSHVSSNEVW
jgi:hypothetical protein